MDKLNSSKFQFTVSEMTEAEIRECEAKEYNYSEWQNIITRYAKYGDTRFFVAKPQNGYSYHRYYAVYTIPEGLRLFHEVSYISVISNNGFKIVTINNGDVISHSLATDNGYGSAANTPRNRKLLAAQSRASGTIFSNEF